MRRLACAVLLLGLAGCADRLAERQAALNQLVGHPEAEILQAFGVPNRTYESDGVSYLAYSDSRVDLVPSAPLYPYPWGPPFYGFYGANAPPVAVVRNCETTFTIADHVVRAVTLRGNACG